MYEKAEYRMISTNAQVPTAPGARDNAPAHSNGGVEHVVSVTDAITPSGLVKGRPQVVVVGCGFAGLNAAQALADASVDVTVIDRRNHHLFAPMLYQAATAQLSPANIAQPIRGILRGQKNVSVLLADVEGKPVFRVPCLAGVGADPRLLYSSTCAIGCS